MFVRTITGAFITLAVYLTIYFSKQSAVILAFTAILCAFAVFEIFRATNMLKNESIFTLSMMIAMGLVFINIPYYTNVVAVTFIVAIVFSIWFMIRKKHIKLANPFCSVLITLAVVLLLNAFPAVRSLQNGVWYLTYAVTVCFVTDVFAYLIGRFFGKHKLIPNISPNKTVEGAVAGVISAILFSLVGGLLLESYGNYEINYLLLSVYTFAASIIGQFGDLSMSTIKRIVGIKDFGNILPGHGGILDRFDSDLFVVPFTYLFCTVTGGFIF